MFVICESFGFQKIGAVGNRKELCSSCSPRFDRVLTLFWIAIQNFIIRRNELNAALYPYLYLQMETGMCIARVCVCSRFKRLLKDAQTVPSTITNPC